MIYHDSWGFVLPERHRVKLDDERTVVTLWTQNRSSRCRLGRIDETDDEIRFHVGSVEEERGAGYPFPTIGEELQRLRQKWQRHAGREIAFPVPTPADDYDVITSRVRTELRQATARRA